jgi:hypothetical protein
MEENLAIAPLNPEFLLPSAVPSTIPSLLASLNLLEIRLMDTKYRPFQFIFLREAEPATAQSRGWIRGLWTSTR